MLSFREKNRRRNHYVSCWSVDACRRLIHICTVGWANLSVKRLLPAWESCGHCKRAFFPRLPLPSRLFGSRLHWRESEATASDMTRMMEELRKPWLFVRSLPAAAAAAGGGRQEVNAVSVRSHEDFWATALTRCVFSTAKTLEQFIYPNRTR